ncbi:MAG: hypothetical protein JRJ58_14280 [Deltaproteobacteria bacterium]|nr:hypothetical protein [Deltaproteobacteria bacterium]
MPLRTFVWSISITVTVVVLGCFDAKGDLPAELLGKWTTAAPAYSERYFEIQEHMIVFGIDAFTTKSHYLERVETKRPLPDGRERFVFHYRAGDGETQSLELEHQTAAPSTLRFGHHTELWTMADKEGQS